MCNLTFNVHGLVLNMFFIFIYFVFIEFIRVFDFKFVEQFFLMRCILCILCWKIYYLAIIHNNITCVNNWKIFFYFLFFLILISFIFIYTNIVNIVRIMQSNKFFLYFILGLCFLIKNSFFMPLRKTIKFGTKTGTPMKATTIKEKLCREKKIFWRLTITYFLLISFYIIRKISKNIFLLNYLWSMLLMMSTRWCVCVCMFRYFYITFWDAKEKFLDL